MTNYKGIYVPIATPVTNAYDGAIDLNKLTAHANWLVEHGVDGILAFGSNSEFYMFEDAEILAAAKALVDAVDVPVIMGIGHIRTSRCVSLAQEAARLGVAAISVLQPMFIKPTQEALYQHFATIAQAVPDLDMFIYNNPGRTGYSITLDIVERLARALPNVVGIKESSGDITVMEELVRRTRFKNFCVMSGKDTTVFPALCVGAQGAVCSTANFVPHLVCGIYDSYVAGDIRASLSFQEQLNPLRLLQDITSFPAATKDMARLVGIDLGPSVLPTCSTQQSLEAFQSYCTDHPEVLIGS